MQKVVFPRIGAENALSLLLSGDRFEILAQAGFHEHGAAAFVIGRFGWSWGHFFRAAFCSLSPSSQNEVTLEVSYLDVQRQWHGRNLFRGIDSRIEEEIADYALANIHHARRV